MKTTIENYTPPVLIQDLGMQYPKESSKQKRRYGLYKCHCGNEFKAISLKNRTTKIKSCGCLAIDVTKKRFADRRKMIIDSPTIKCRSCNIILDKSNFNKDSRYVSGYSGECRECSKNRKKKEYIKHRAKILNRSKSWYVANKDKKREYDKIYKKNITEDKRKLRIEYQRRYRKTDRGRSITISHLHNRRAKIKNIVPHSEISNIIRRSKKCYWCGVPLKNKKVHIDHYVPLAKGGLNSIENLVVSCAKCNLTKNAKDPIAFANSIGKLL